MNGNIWIGLGQDIINSHKSKISMDNGGLMGINEWGFMRIYNIPGLSINPHKSGRGFMD